MDPRRLRLLLALALVLSGIGAGLSGFFSWLVVPTESAGRSVVDGWGVISGNTVLDGENLNALTGEEGSFRPALPALTLGILLIAGAITLLPRPRGDHPYRIGAAITALVAIALAGWGVWRSVDPDPLAILGEGESAVGAGPWVVLVCGLVALAAVVPVFLGRLDEQVVDRPRHPGIQP